MSLTALSSFARRVQAINKIAWDVNECTCNDLDRGPSRGGGGIRWTSLLKHGFALVS